VLGDSSVLVLDGERHMHQRKLLLPPLHGSRVAGYRQVIREVAERELAGWRPGRRLVLRERMRALTFEVICRVVFGVADPGRVERLRSALVAVIDSSPVYMLTPLARRDLGPLSPGRRFVTRLRAADTLLLDEIARRRREPDLDERSDVLSLLLGAVDEEGRPMSDRELRDELFTMLAAGHETTAVALFWSCYILARAPEAQRRIADEAGALDLSPAAASEALSRLLYTRAVIDETLRLYPPAFSIVRQARASDAAAGVAIRPRAVILIVPWLLHRHRKLWRDPDLFMPERFLPGAEPPTRFSYLPFGAGPRACIGAQFALTEAVVVLARLVREFAIELADPRPVLPLALITLQPDHRPPFRLRRR
jgi:cytochrome P450